MDEFNLVVMKESAQEIIDWKAKSALEEGGEHYNFICIRCWDVLPSSRSPLEHDTIKEKAIFN
jgi:hypothetical protein